jgi:hypothetical protein
MELQDSMFYEGTINTLKNLENMNSYLKLLVVKRGWGARKR